MTGGEKYLTVNQVSALLGRTASDPSQMYCAGKFPTAKQGAGWYFSPTKLRAGLSREKAYHLKNWQTIKGCNWQNESKDSP